MAWEDCVVDVHSVKFSQQTLESMFSKCGAVRSVIHWKGQGEKQHVFMEYRSPSAAEAARAIGLDRSDLQVIKLSNNEMLKRKFRELEKLSENRPHSTRPYSDRNTDAKVTAKDYSLPAKPTVVPMYTGERGTEGRYRNLDYERSRPRHVPSGPSLSSSRVVGQLGLFEGSRPRSLENIKSSAPRQPSSTPARAPTKTDVSDSLMNRDLVTSGVFKNGKLDYSLPMVSRSPMSCPLGEASTGHKGTYNGSAISLSMIEIPHAGELIKFDLRHLEPNPVGIISMLSTVKADQKLWMMTAAHYNGNHNLKAAKEVLEAGIDMAVQTGVETDTKPFWHLLSQVNENIKASDSSCLSVFSSSPTTSTSTLIGDSCNQPAGLSCPERMDTSIEVPSLKEEHHPADGPNDHGRTSPDTKEGFPSASEPGTATSAKAHPLPHYPSASFQQHPRPTGPRNRGPHLELISASPVPSPASPAQLFSLQSEIGTLREKQTVVLEDLSFMRAAKRRAEDEVKEERSIRRKLEKHLRAAEDALARSKRMEDAALDQVKREVEARRKAEELLAVAKAERDKTVGPSLFMHPTANDATMLLQLASMIRGVSSNEPATPWQLGIGAARAVGAGAASSTAGSQLET